MKRLTKADSEQQDSLVRNLTEKADAVKEVLTKINALINDELNPAISEYNGIIADAEEFRNEIVGRMDDYVDGRSEKWSESEAGENYTSWKDEWEGISFEEISTLEDLEIEEVDFIEGENCPVATELEQLNAGPAE
jgi:hypothetical protein